MADSIPPSPAGAHPQRTGSNEWTPPLPRVRRWWPWRRVGSLRWWLGTTYMRVTLVAVMIVELVGLVVLTQAVLYAVQQNHTEVAEQLSPVASDLLAAGVDGDALLAYLERPTSLRSEQPPLGVMVPKGSKGYTVVTDGEGGVWFDNRVAPEGGDDAGAAGTRRFQDLPERLEGPDRALVQRTLDGGEPARRRGLLHTSSAHPLVGEDGRTRGALLLVSTLLPATPGLLAFGLSVLAVATVLVVLIGTVFGLYASRPLVRRIEALSGAADAWGRGDFARAVNDSSNDELGRLSRRLDHMAEELRELVRARQALAGTRERTRIARELHDSVKQQVFAASMRLGSARAARGDAAASHVAAAEALVRQAQQELSDLIYQLRPPTLDPRPLGQALHELAETFAESGGPRVDLDVDAGASPTPERSAALYRIAQEALANAVRHARATRVTLSLHRTDAAWVLRVADDGRGFDVARTRDRGVGLASMRERAEALGGRIDIDTRVGGDGTRIEARIPVASGRDAEAWAPA
ncbi:MAG: histidine kinase [Trueperaceae bacterium]|nr:histidine kinase [Trueperaceae bacterium]